MKKILLLLTLMLTFSLAWATIINVPGSYPTIQEGINAAVDGDTVLVADGIYTGTSNKNLQFYGTSLVLMSENGPDNTVIDCQNSGKGFMIQNGSANGEKVIGIKVINGATGGVFVYNSSTEFINCHFNNNSSSGVLCSYSDATFDHCIFYNNTNAGNGGGIYLNNADALLINCTFSNNSAGVGGAIYCYNSDPEINSCIISYNTVSG
jgi:predicted outer membrane repeat protein